MAKWVCNVCGYVYEGETAPKHVRSVKHRLINSQNRQKA